MATKKDLVEAHAFSRRRLVTAFVSGAPGGREVEPVRPGRVLIGGVALSVLLLAGAAIAGFLLGRPPAQWLEAGSFIISKDTGEQYVVMRGGDDPLLQRVPNYVSAQLLLEQADLTPYTVRDKYIRTVQLGEDLGIEGAPAGLPSADELVDDGWTACTGVRRRHQGRHPADARRSRTSPGRRSWSPATTPEWLIATAPAGRQPSRAAPTASRCPPTRRSASTVGNKLGFGASATEVDEEWLNLFPLGEPLEEESFGVTRDGRAGALRGDRHRPLAATASATCCSRAPATTTSSATSRSSRSSDFAGMVYDVVGSTAVQLDGDLRAPTSTTRTTPASGPPACPRPWTAARCAACCTPAPASTPRSASPPTRPAPPTRPRSPRPRRHEVDVEPSAGAYVLSGSDDAADGGTPYVIDTKGEKYVLIGPQVPDFIGYGEVEPPLVPSTWLEFFEPGVPLSTNSARRVPEDAPPRRRRSRKRTAAS